MRRRFKAATVALLMAVSLGTAAAAYAYDPSDYNGGDCNLYTPLDTAWWIRRCWLPDPPPNPMT